MITLTAEERNTLNDREAEILQRAHDATPGPWTTTNSGMYDVVLDAIDTDALCGPDQVANANFMAHARDDVPYLLKEVIKLREELAAMRAAMLLAAIV